MESSSVLTTENVVVGKLSEESVAVLKGVGLSPSDVVDWIKSHGYQGAALLRTILPVLLAGADPKVTLIITTILDLLYPVAK